MMIIGLLLVCATGAFTGLLIAGNLGGGPTYDVTILGTTLATMNSLEIFLSGVALGLLFCAGLWLLVRGTGRTAPGVAVDRRESVERDDVRTSPPIESVDEAGYDRADADRSGSSVHRWLRSGR